MKEAARSLKERFPRLPALFVVVHVFDDEQTVANVTIAKKCGADGVWLIAHGNNMAVSQLDLLASCFRRVRSEFPDYFVGVNVLALTMQPLKLWPWVVANLEGCDGVWSDTCFAAYDKVLPRVDEERRRFPGLYFGGVAFKHQEQVHPLQDSDEIPAQGRKALAAAAAAARPFVDCVVTSGTRTGKMPSLQKVQAVAKGARPGGVGLSGAGLDMAPFAGLVDAFLAATALSKVCSQHRAQDSCTESFCWLDESKVLEWVKARPA